MKKLTILVLMLTATFALNAQNDVQLEDENVLSKSNEIVKTSRNHRTIDRSTAFFYEDFANGLNGNNGVGAWTTTGVDSALWLYDLDGPNGNFSDTSQIIDSETQSNGFMIFDADFSNPIVDQGNVIERTGSLASPVLDFSNRSSVFVSFSQAYRLCCSSSHQLSVEVSIDGGVSFPYEFIVNKFGDVNAAYSNLFRVNISEVAGGQSSVVFRFTWGAGTASHYYWQIDDVSIDSAPISDLEMLTIERASWGNLGYGDFNWALGQVPYDLAKYQAYMAVVKNYGDYSVDAYLMLELAVNGDTIIIGDSLNTMMIPPYGGIDTLVVVFNLEEWMTGDYAVKATVHERENNILMDATIEDNTLPAQFSITEDCLAAIPRNYIAFVDHDNLFGSDELKEPEPVDYYIRWIQFEPITFRAMATAFTDNTEVGAKIKYGIYGTNSDQFIDLSKPLFVGTNSKKVGNNIVDVGVEAEMLGKRRVMLSFMSVNSDDEFNEYLYQDSVILPGNSLGVVYAASISLPGDQVAGIIGARRGNGQGNDQLPAAYGLYGTGDEMTTRYTQGINMIELYRRIDSATVISEIPNRPDFYLAQNRPNPFQSGTTITYQLNKKASIVSFNVYDVAGKQVMNIDEGSRGAGQYNIELDATEFTTGLYYYSLTVNGQKLTRKMVVTE
jgi:hypothetical protein